MYHMLHFIVVIQLNTALCVCSLTPQSKSAIHRQERREKVEQAVLVIRERTGERGTFISITVSLGGKRYIVESL